MAKAGWLKTIPEERSCFLAEVTRADTPSCPLGCCSQIRELQGTSLACVALYHRPSLSPGGSALMESAAQRRLRSSPPGARREMLGAASRASPSGLGPPAS